MKQILIAVVLIVIFIIIFLFTRGNEALEEQSKIDKKVVENSEITLPDGQFLLNKEESTLGWSAYKVTGSGHNGQITIKEGILEISDGMLISGDFTIDMTTITDADNNEAFLNHVRNDDFFSVEQFPETNLSVIALEQQDESNYLVSSDLTIKGITNKIQFPAVVTQSEDGLSIMADIVIDRTRWGVNFGSGSVFADIGDAAINDNIDFQLKLVMNKQ